MEVKYTAITEQEAVQKQEASVLQNALLMLTVLLQNVEQAQSVFPAVAKMLALQFEENVKLIAIAQNVVEAATNPLQQLLGT